MAIHYGSGFEAIQFYLTFKVKKNKITKKDRENMVEILNKARNKVLKAQRLTF